MIVEPIRASLRGRIYRQLDPASRDEPGLSVTNRFLVVLILLATLLFVLDTEPLVHDTYGDAISATDLIFGVLFLVEYIARLWSSVESQQGPGGWRSRVQFATSPAALIDLVAVVGTLTPLVSGNVLALRALRLARIVRIAKLGRMTRAMTFLQRALHSRRYELLVTLSLALVIMLCGATAMWWAEGDVQPDHFGSIPRALWWALITLTTIGYGDVYPTTALGKAVAGIFALAGVGLIALPAGIMASAFSDEVQRENERRDIGEGGLD